MLQLRIIYSAAHADTALARRVYSLFDVGGGGGGDLLTSNF
jgi:hypothetical protein